MAVYCSEQFQAAAVLVEAAIVLYSLYWSRHVVDNLRLRTCSVLKNSNWEDFRKSVLVLLQLKCGAYIKESDRHEKRNAPRMFVVSIDRSVSTTPPRLKKVINFLFTDNVFVSIISIISEKDSSHRDGVRTALLIFKLFLRKSNVPSWGSSATYAPYRNHCQRFTTIVPAKFYHAENSTVLASTNVRAVLALLVEMKFVYISYRYLL